MNADKVFVDTSVLVYAHDVDAAAKHAAANSRLKDLWAAGAGALSTQVLQEFYVSSTRKIRSPIDRASARDIVRQYGAWVFGPITVEHVIRASEVEEFNKLAFWDALVIVSAAAAGARVLLTEDLNHGQIIDGVRIENPF